MRGALSSQPIYSHGDNFGSFTPKVAANGDGIEANLCVIPPFPYLDCADPILDLRISGSLFGSRSGEGRTSTESSNEDCAGERSVNQ